MIRYLLDTDICFYVLRSAHGTRERLAAHRAVEVAVSSVTLAEGWAGARKTAEPERWLSAWRALVSPWTVLDFDAASAEAYSILRAHLEERGTMMGGNDCMIAATALAHRLTLVTHNTKEFRRVPKLRLADWASRP